MPCPVKVVETQDSMKQKRKPPQPYLYIEIQKDWACDPNGRVLHNTNNIFLFASFLWVCDCVFHEEISGWFKNKSSFQPKGPGGFIASSCFSSVCFVWYITENPIWDYHCAVSAF